MGPIEKGIDEEDMWTINYLGFMHCCMEEGWLSDANMKNYTLGTESHGTGRSQQDNKGSQGISF